MCVCKQSGILMYNQTCIPCRWTTCQPHFDASLNGCSICHELYCRLSPDWRCMNGCGWRNEERHGCTRAMGRVRGRQVDGSGM